VSASGHPHVACCVSDSPSGRAALREALALRDEKGGRLSLLHAGPYPLAVQTIDGRTSYRREDLNAAAREWLRRRAAGIPGAEPVFLTGSLGPATCEWARRAGADLIVIGGGSGRMTGLRAGSAVHHLLERAPCSVLVVRPLVRPAPEIGESLCQSTTSPASRP
jgi:nucleotide-binding universal stress UspA family protein